MAYFLGPPCIITIYYAIWGKCGVLCSHFGWQLVNFVYSRTDLSNSGFLSYFYNQVSDTEWCEAELLKDVLSTRDDESEIIFAAGSGLELSHLNCLILNVATNRA